MTPTTNDSTVRRAARIAVFAVTLTAVVLAGGVLYAASMTPGNGPYSDAPFAHRVAYGVSINATVALLIGIYAWRDTRASRKESNS